MADISRLVRTAIQSRLSNTTNGFNANYAALVTSYNAPPIQIDWSDQSVNFCYGLLPPTLVEQTSPFQYPLLTISSDRAAMDRPGQRVHSHQFSGTVQATIQVILSWADEGIRDFETWPDAVIDALFQTANNINVANVWGAGITYNGQMSFSKGSILLAGSNWRRQVLFPIEFKVLVAG